MNDYVWFIITGILFVLLGLLFIWLGWQILIKQKMNLIISYHCDKVSEENKRAYCTLSGIGVLIMGLGFLFSAVCLLFSQSLLIFVPMAVGLGLGTALLASAGIKYNR